MNDITKGLQTKLEFTDQAQNSLIMDEPSLKSPSNYRKNVKHLTLQTTNLLPILEKSEKSEELIMSSRIEDQNEKNQTKNSPNKWKLNNFLEVKVNDNTEIKTPTSSQRLSAMNEDRIMDLFELVLNLERMKNYSFYFPHNNAEIIVHQLQTMSSRSMKSRKRTFHRRRLVGNSKNSTSIPVVQSENLIKLM